MNDRINVGRRRIQASTARPVTCTVTRLDYVHPDGGVVASMVLEGIDAPDDDAVWVLILPDHIVKCARLLAMGGRWATQAETEQDARVCLNRAGAAILAWDDRRQANDRQLDNALEAARSTLGVRQASLPLEGDGPDGGAPQ